MRYLLDTCVLSEVVKARPTASVLAWLDCAQDCYLSCLTIGELEKGIALAPDSRRAKLKVWLETRVLLQFSGRVLDVEVAVARQWGALQARLRREGVLLPAVDGLLAATALVHGLILVTRNERDFAATGVRIHNPWV